MTPHPSWLQRIRDTWLCGVRPHRLEARDADGRYLAGTPWDGDRRTAVNLLCLTAEQSGEVTFTLEITCYRWDDNCRRRSQLLSLDFTAPMHELAEEQRTREQARAARTARRVNWHAPHRPLARRVAA